MDAMREQIITWTSRISVVGSVATVPLLDSALTDMRSATRFVSVLALWAVWAGALLCVLVPASSSLTALRLLVPIHTATTWLIVVTHSDGGPGWSSILAVALSSVATIAAMSGEVGRHWVQLSAYGDERRFLLSCPPTMIAAQVFAWMVWFGLALTAVTTLTKADPTATQSIIGFVAGAMSLAGAILLPRRFHRFSRRWLVWVPAGLVVHDQVLLAETAMMSKRSLAAVDVWHPGDEPAPLDLIGGTPGIPKRTGLVVSLHEAETVILAPTKEHPGGRALHVRSFAVRPTRLRPALAELSTRLPSHR